MIPCAQQESACKEEMQSQASGPSRFVDEHLADDPVEEECQNAVLDSLDLCLSQAAIEVPRPLEGESGSGHGEAIAKVDDANKDTTGVENAAATPNTSKQSVNAEFGVSAEEEPSEENSSLVHHVKPVESEAGFESAGRVVKDDDNNVSEEMLEDLVSENAGDLVGHGPSLESSPSGTRQATHLVDQTTVSFAPFLPDVQQHRIGDRKKEEPISSSSLCDHGIQSIKLLQPGEARHADEWDSTSQLLPESFENVQAHDNPNGEKSSLPSNETVEFLVPFGCKEPSLNQHGMHRRSLLFEDAEAHRNSMGSNCSSLNPASIVPESRSPGTPVDSEALSSSCIADLNTDFGNDHIANFSKQSSARLSICPYKTPEPDKVTGYVHDSSNPHVTVPVPSGIGLHLNSIGDTVAMSCATNVQLSEGDYLSVQGEEPLSEVTKNFSEGLRSCSVSVDVVVNVSVQATSNSVPPLDITVAENSEINHQENEASGMGYSSTSFHAVPLNVKALNSSLESNLSERYLRPCEKKRPVSQDGCGFGEHSQRSPKKNRLEPPNATENEGCKRCNCKKSKCLKLYCECFAAGVYCIEPCTCLVCFNKPEHEDTVLATRQQIESRNPLAFAPRVVRRVDESPFSSGEDASWTPASARHKRGCNCKKSKCLKKYCECYQAGVGCSVGCRCEGCKNIFGKKDEYGEFIKMKYTEVEGWDDPSEEKLDMVEPKGDILHPKQCHSDLSPVTPFFRCSSLGREMTKSHLPARGYLRTPDSEISNVSLSYAKPPRSPSVSISCTNRFAKGGEGNLGFVSFEKGQNNPNAEKIDQFRTGSGRLSTSSAHWHGSSVTPMPHAGAKFLVESDSDSGVDNILDDTPEILKDANSPIKVVKVRSPNQKRVSPPHNYLQELRRLSPSLGLRSGRKFILQSVPSLPRLTPYNEAKGSHK